MAANLEDAFNRLQSVCCLVCSGIVLCFAEGGSAMRVQIYWLASLSPIFLVLTKTSIAHSNREAVLPFVFLKLTAMPAEGELPVCAICHDALNGVKPLWENPDM